MKIKELTLHTTQLERQSHFYEETLGFEKINQATDRVSFKVGDSILTFIQRDEFTPYHFAINIPSNQVKAALTWLKQRVNILKDGDNIFYD